MELKSWMKLKNGTDVRGIASEGVEGDSINLTDEVVTKIAKAFYIWVLKKTNQDHATIAVGHDSRISAPRLLKCVKEGITSCGGDVVVTGLSSTPSMFMLLQKESYHCDGSIMLTASHLPFHRNGLKFFLKDGGLEGNDISELLTLAYQNEFPCGNGSVSEKPFLDEYAMDLVALLRKATGEEKPLKNKKIIVDAGNGAGGFYATKVLEPLGADISGSQFLDPDGTFPNHIPNPENKEAMHSICDAVIRNHADLGIIFDTDVDRAGAVDKFGNEINRNRLIALISAIILEENKGAYIVTDSVTSDGLTTFIHNHGGVHHRYKRGYKNVINEAKRLCSEGKYAPLAIETSGHAALKENYFLDDGAYLITKLLISVALLSKKNLELHDLLKDLPMPLEEAEVRPTFKDPESDFKALGQKVLDNLLQYAQNTPYITLAKSYEGVRMNFDSTHGDGWILVRMSLHEPIMPINLESNQKGGVEKLIQEIKNFLSQYEFLNLTPFDK